MKKKKLKKASVKKKYKIHLKSMEDIRRLLSTTVNQFRRNEITSDQAKTITYMGNVLLGVMKSISEDMIDKRIKVLEDEHERFRKQIKQT
ncbi:MAG: hypothetical protein C4522_12590 [Desulfobacteraceae bacterium]|nr:MAG: hypothetical protein C4522_12590 [Desulfobacteraceae bacterium]